MVLRACIIAVSFSLNAWIAQRMDVEEQNRVRGSEIGRVRCLGVS